MFIFADKTKMYEFINRNIELFNRDINNNLEEIKYIISNSSFLVIGGAGSIGSAVVREIFERNPRVLHVVDISENGLTELVRDLRSSIGYIDGEFKTFALDIGTGIYDRFFENYGRYDYVLNFSALKHVRSEKDPFTLMRMIEVNILNTEKTLEQCIKKRVKKYFCVSTDKATKPVNLMGASKRIMELFLMEKSKDIDITTARFANVLFSDGSLPQSFLYRLEKNQPISAPNDVKRYFITKEESGRLCLLALILGDNRDIFIPKIEKLKPIGFDEIAIKLLKNYGYEPFFCSSEEQARELVKTLPQSGKWPCYFSASDTTGEKEIEEFYTDNDLIERNKFLDIDIIKSKATYNKDKLIEFKKKIKFFKEKGWNKSDLVELFSMVLGDELDYKDLGKYLDDKM